jgi:hypothetical protein
MFKIKSIPSVCEEKLELDVSADSLVQPDRDVPGLLQDLVWHVLVHDRLGDVVLTADAEPNNGTTENLEISFRFRFI